MAWTDHLTNQEKQRLADIEGERRSLTAEYRRIYDRCRKRMKAQTPSSPGAFPNPGEETS